MFDDRRGFNVIGVDKEDCRRSIGCRLRAGNAGRFMSSAIELQSLLSGCGCRRFGAGGHDGRRKCNDCCLGGVDRLAAVDDIMVMHVRLLKAMCAVINVTDSNAMPRPHNALLHKQSMAGCRRTCL